MKPFKSLYDLLAEQSCISNKLFAELLVPVIRVILKTCKWRKLMLRQKWAGAITWVKWRGVYLSSVLANGQVKEIPLDSLNVRALKSCGKLRPPLWLKFGIISFGIMNFGIINFGIMNFGIINFGIINFGIINFGIINFGTANIYSIGEFNE